LIYRPVTPSTIGRRRIVGLEKVLLYIRITMDNSIPTKGKKVLKYAIEVSKQHGRKRATKSKEYAEWFRYYQNDFEVNSC
jgi:hypothetical protein